MQAELFYALHTHGFPFQVFVRAPKKSEEAIAEALQELIGMLR